MNRKQKRRFIGLLCLCYSIQLYTFGQINLYTFNSLQIGKNIPAALSALEQSNWQIDFSDEFCTKEMMHKSLLGNLHLKQNSIHLRIHHYGYAKYGELTTSFGYGRNFGNHFALALCGHYLFNHAEQYASIHSFTLDFSAFYKITKTINLAVEVYNPFRLRYGIRNGEIIPMQFIVQASYLPSEKIGATLSCRKILPGAFDVGVDLLYHPHPILFLQSSVSHRQLSFGVSLFWRQVLFSINAAWYYQVSSTLGANLTYLKPSKQ